MAPGFEALNANVERGVVIFHVCHQRLTHLLLGLLGAPGRGEALPQSEVEFGVGADSLQAFGKHRDAQVFFAQKGQGSTPEHIGLAQDGVRLAALSDAPPQPARRLGVLAAKVVGHADVEQNERMVSLLGVVQAQELPIPRVLLGLPFWRRVVARVHHVG